jgi:hypothetical protein
MDTDRIIAWLDKVQARDVRKDDGYGIRSAKQIAQAVGLDKSTCRELLTQLAADGRVLRCDHINGVFWRSMNPLPWEVGGEAWKRQQYEAEVATHPKTLIIQAVWFDGRDTILRDVESYPEAHRGRAEASVQHKNWETERRRRDEICGSGRVRWPTYRLVELRPYQSSEAA